VGTKREKIASVVMVLVGGLLVAFSMGRWLAPLAGWVGPVLIIRYARDHKVWRGYAVVLAAYIVAIFIAFFSIWWGGLHGLWLPSWWSASVSYGACPISLTG
jgi:hypothetical protein